MFDLASGGGPGPGNVERLELAKGAAAAAVPEIAAARQSSVSFPGTADQVTRARSFLASFLAGSPLADDAVLCLSEVASNSVLYSNSRREGGHFTVSAERYDDGCIRVEVEDQGGPWIQRTKPEGQQSLGLAIVGTLAWQWGIKDAHDCARTVWFEVGPVPSAAQAAA